MDEKYYLDVVIKKERLSNGGDVFVAYCNSLGIASQGFNIDEAMKNIKEASELYLEEQPEKYQELEVSFSLPSFSIIEVKKNAKASNLIR